MHTPLEYSDRVELILVLGCKTGHLFGNLCTMSAPKQILYVGEHFLHPILADVVKDGNVMLLRAIESDEKFCTHKRYCELPEFKYGSSYFVNDLVEANRTLCKVTGFDEEKVVCQSVADRFARAQEVHPRDLALIKAGSIRVQMRMQNDIFAVGCTSRGAYREFIEPYIKETTPVWDLLPRYEPIKMNDYVLLNYISIIGSQFGRFTAPVPWLSVDKPPQWPIPPDVNVVVHRRGSKMPEDWTDSCVVSNPYRRPVSWVKKAVLGDTAYQYAAVFGPHLVWFELADEQKFLPLVHLWPLRTTPVLQRSSPVTVHVYGHISKTEQFGQFCVVGRILGASDGHVAIYHGERRIGPLQVLSEFGLTEITFCTVDTRQYEFV